jgi:hypothetical protein
MSSRWTVWCRDTFDGTQWSEKFDTEAEARAYAARTSGTMLTCHIDDPSGKLAGKKGTY